MIEISDQTTYMDQAYLTYTARRAIRDEAKAAGVKARYVGWLLMIRNDTDKPALLAKGRRSDGVEFAVRVAI